MKLGGRIKEGQWFTLSFIGMGVAGVYYALSADLPLAIVLVAFTGLLNAPYSVGRRLVIQRNTSREVRPGSLNFTIDKSQNAPYNRPVLIDRRAVY